MAVLSATLSVLWWIFWLGLLAYVVGRELWSRRPWRKKPEPFARAYDRIIARTRREMEERELAEMEAQGLPMWKPRKDLGVRPEA